MSHSEPQREFRRVHFKRLEIARGDIALSYSLDEISAGKPLRPPFEHASSLWICTSMSGGNATSSGLSEFEAYRLSRVPAFKGVPVSFKARTGSAEAGTAADADPNGLYHGVLVKFGRAKSVLCGPPVTFVAREVTRRPKRETLSRVAEPDANETSSPAAEPSSAAERAASGGASSSEVAICTVPAPRLNDDTGDIHASYSADRIGMDQPVRRPFKHDGALWICTTIDGSGLTTSGTTEHEAYRLVPERMFIGPPTTYGETIGTAESADAARKAPNGFYHAMKVRFASLAFVLCGPPLRFVAAQRPDAAQSEPAQLSLF